MNIKPESILIEASPRGISAVTIRVPRGAREHGLALLTRAMPALTQLDRDVREETVKKQAEGNDAGNH